MYALIEGNVSFSVKSGGRSVVSVTPSEAPAKQAAE
jgi:ribosomal protein L27